MQLLHSSLFPAPEFVSLSLLLRSKVGDEGVRVVEALVVPAPLSTVSNEVVSGALDDLHAHLTVTLTQSSSARTRMATEWLREDEKLVNELQVYHPLRARGLGLNYRLIRGDGGLLSTLTSLVMASNKNAGAVKADAFSNVLGVVFCVGLSGIGYACAANPLQYTLSQRMNECTALLRRTGANDVSSAKSIVSALLLTDDELRKTNEMAENVDLCVLPETEDGDKSKGIMSPMGMISPLAVGKRVKRMSMKGGIEENVPMDIGVPLTLSLGSADASRAMMEKLNVLSVVEGETHLRKYEHSGQERKANLDLMGGTKSRFQRRRKADGKDADFDGFDYKGPRRIKGGLRPLRTALQNPEVHEISANKSNFRNPKKDTRGKGAAIPALSASRSDAVNRRMSTQTLQTDDDGQSATFDPFSQSQHASHRNRRSNNRSMFDDETVESSRTNGQGGARLQVNIALNEDLSCSYRQAQLSSCSVEGVVQVQVKSTVRSIIPFQLIIRDTAVQLDSIQENQKFAEDTSDNVENVEDEILRGYTISVPQSDNYFPVLRYKCNDDLRPVPMRVQTRVKTDAGYCRVALQISSNPNNAAALTDLTIIMGVPDEVKGESVITQPTGGVWDEAKRSVVWFVSELGEGEKFQLQARFELDNGLGISEELPNFPVLVRCQCLFAQLSAIELEVRDLPQLSPAEMTMKIARRFRLSHRERA